MSLTAEPLKAGPEWLRPRDMRSTYGIGRAHAYNLLREGKIHGVLLRQPGKATGIRLFSAQSVRDYIASQTGDGNGGRTRGYYAELGRKGATQRSIKGRS
jgi:hypothetical protein